MSQSYQQEEQNDHRLNELHKKISLLRGVTNDIYDQANDTSFIDNATESMNHLMTSVKSSSTRLARSIQAGHPIFKTVGCALAIILGCYVVIHVFW